MKPIQWNNLHYINITQILEIIFFDFIWFYEEEGLCVDSYFGFIVCINVNGLHQHQFICEFNEKDIVCIPYEDQMAHKFGVSPDFEGTPTLLESQLLDINIVDVFDQLEFPSCLVNFEECCILLQNIQLFL